MRKIVEDNREFQVQLDEGTGIKYHYRKDYVGTGDRKEDYSLVLLYVRKPRPKEERSCTCVEK